MLRFPELLKITFDELCSVYSRVVDFSALNHGMVCSVMRYPETCKRYCEVVKGSFKGTEILRPNVRSVMSPENLNHIFQGVPV